MPHFSQTSITNLSSCDGRLVQLFLRVVKNVDCTIIEGYRSKEKQATLLRQGLTRLQHSKHNQVPSHAVDVAPYPIDWEDYEKFYWFGGYVKGIADSLGLEIRWGGDWDGDGDFHDQTLVDLVHFEIEER